jgi:hypothetical protein
MDVLEHKLNHIVFTYLISGQRIIEDLGMFSDTIRYQFVDVCDKLHLTECEIHESHFLNQTMNCFQELQMYINQVRQGDSKSLGTRVRLQ